jgi:hypothetical protein
MKEAYIKKWIPGREVRDHRGNTKSIVPGFYEKDFKEKVIFHEFSIRTENGITTPVAIVELESGEVITRPLSHLSFKLIENSK